MKQIILFLLISQTLSCQLSAQSKGEKIKELYPISENGLWGYINTSGKVKIKPKFRTAGQFSEGLAPVRVNGTYGYIDPSGEFVIQPRFDVAYKFSSGQARVCIDAKPYYIDTQGEILFEHNYSEISDFGDDEITIVKTKTGLYGVIDRNGILIADTIYRIIKPFNSGVAVVGGLTDKSQIYNKEKKAKFGVIDKKGKIIIPFGIYKRIEDFKSGFSKVELDVEYQKGYYNHQGVIDTTGKYRFTVPAKNWHFDYGNEHFSECLAAVDIYLLDPDSIKTWSSSSKNDYKAVINTNGEILFSNKTWEEITPFKNNRAFVKNDDKWFLIDNKGDLLNGESYDDILFHSYGGNSNLLFEDGIQFVETDKGWGAIDTSGKFVVKPKDIGYNARDLERIDNFIIIEDDISMESDKYSYQYGYWNTKSGAIVEPQFHYINNSGFRDDLVYVSQDGEYGYINHKGKYVWRVKGVEKQEITNFNIDYMNRGYCYASSPYKKELAGFGGWGGSGNDFRQMSKFEVFNQETLNVLVVNDDTTTYKKLYNGMKLYVANPTADTFYFEAQDSRLYMKIQAMDKFGEWKDIEYLPGSWCGNSYHKMFLSPDNFWEFDIPKYEGEFKTKLRAQLRYLSSQNPNVDALIYSNEFKGSVNPGQFWRKDSYYSSGLMDPYND